MSTKLTQAAYEQLIKEDIAALEKHMPNSSERWHIDMILRNSINFYYPPTFENKMKEINEAYEGY